jgi:hypothetical protein
MANTSKIAKLGIDLYHGNLGNFSKEEAENAFRRAIFDLMGGSEKFDRKAFRRNKTAIFEVTEEILDVLITEGIEQQFADFVDYRNVGYGDKIAFMVEDYHLFNVAVIANGNSNITRQRLERAPFFVTTQSRGVKIYEEWQRFLSGKVDWAQMVNKVQRSFNAQIAADIYNAIVAGYSALNAPYKYTGSFDITQYNTLLQHIRAATDRDPLVAGTRLALQKVVPPFVAYNGQMIEQRNQDGFFRIVDGVTHIELKQAHVPGTDTFAIADNFLLVVPAGEEKIVKLVLEGEPEIVETTTMPGQNADDTVEYLFKKKYGVGVVTSTKFGAYILS